jgi:hypothetical protein
MGAMVKFLIIAAGLPIAGLIGNSLVRLAFRLPQSAAADLILVLIILDLTILIQPAELEAAIPHVRIVYGFVVFFSFVMWVIAIGRIEQDLRAWMASRPRRGYPFRIMFISLAVSGLALVVNLAPIAWRSSG